MMESKLISANLKTLADKGIVEKIETDKRNLLYRISERFFNMWLIMTQGNPEQKRKAQWLNIFLENWYNDAELKTMAQKRIDNQNAFAEVEKNFSMVAEKSYDYISKGLVALYYQQNKNKVKALEYIQRYKGVEDLQIIIELWNGIFKDLENRALAAIKEVPDLSWFIRHLLIHQQKILVFNLFNHPEVGQSLQDKYKTLHYVCLILNKKTEDNLILRIPPEIRPTIDEIIEDILEEEKRYGYRK